jgi:hypothetical protein
MDAGTMFFVPPVGFMSDIHNNTSVGTQSLPSPTACTLGSLSVTINPFEPAGSDTTTITVYHNLSASLITCQVTTNTTIGSCTDTTHTVSVSKGDLLSVAFIETNAIPFNAISITMTCQ